MFGCFPGPSGPLLEGLVSVLRSAAAVVPNSGCFPGFPGSGPLVEVFVFSSGFFPGCPGAGPPWEVLFLVPMTISDSGFFPGLPGSGPRSEVFVGGTAGMVVIPRRTAAAGMAAGAGGRGGVYLLFPSWCKAWVVVKCSGFDSCKTKQG